MKCADGLIRSRRGCEYEYEKLPRSLSGPREFSLSQHLIVLGGDVAHDRLDGAVQVYKDGCQSISYDNLSRTPDVYEGTDVKFTGRVLQVCSEATSAEYYSTYRVATSGRYDNVVMIYVDNYGSGTRILEDDWITFYGSYGGLYTYTTVLGASVTIPKIYVEYLD